MRAVHLVASVKYFTHDRYIPLFIEYFNFYKKDVRASTLFLLSFSETVRLET